MHRAKSATDNSRATSREHHKPQRHDRRPSDGEQLVTTPAADNTAAQDRGDQHSKHHRHQHEAGCAGAHSLCDLQIDREKGDRPEKRKPDDETDAAGDHEVAVAKETHRQERLTGMPFDHNEARGAYDAQADQTQRNGRTPGKPYAPKTVEQDGSGECHGEQGSAAVVDLMPATHAGRGQRCGNHEQSEQARGQIDVEYPAPGQGDPTKKPPSSGPMMVARPNAAPKNP